jgi:uncharacterized membrane protein YgcG
MFSNRWLLFSAVALASWLADADVAPAAAPPGVNDEAKFFSAEAVEKANQKIQKINADYSKTPLLIETVPAIPADLQAKLKELGPGKFFSYWAVKRMEDAKHNGIYILLCRDPGQLQIEVHKNTREKAFPQADVDRLVKVMSAQLQETKFDAALIEGVDFVQATLQKNLAKSKAAAGKNKSSKKKG